MDDLLRKSSLHLGLVWLLLLIHHHLIACRPSKRQRQQQQKPTAEESQTTVFESKDTEKRRCGALIALVALLQHGSHMLGVPLRSSIDRLLLLILLPDGATHLDNNSRILLHRALMASLVRGTPSCSPYLVDHWSGRGGHMPACHHVYPMPYTSSVWDCNNGGRESAMFALRP